MMSPEPRPEEFVQAATQFARTGGAVVMQYFRQELKLATKGIANLVSAADVESERAIVAQIRDMYPGHAILAEESFTELTEARHLWVVDPLDGTNNFAHGIPHFAVSIAYYYEQQAQCGVVWNPARADLFVASKGKGAYCNQQRMQVSTEGTLDQALIGTGFYYDRGAMMRRTLRSIQALFEQDVHGIRRFGTASLDLCQVACGMFGGYFEYELAPWDFAAGRLIVEEAGGRITDCDGGELPLATTSVLASNDLLHEPMLTICGATSRD